MKCDVTHTIYIDIRNSSLLELEKQFNINKNYNYFVSNIEEYDLAWSGDLELWNSELKEANSNLFILISSENYLVRDSKYSNITFLFFPYYLLRKSYFNATDVYNNKIKNKLNKFDSLFICLNHHPRENRITTLDYLEKYKLFDYGNYTLDYLNNECSTKYWNQKINKIDDTINFNVGMPDHWNLIDYQNPLVNIVTETLYYTGPFFLTEKTAKPLLYGQLFLVVGTQYFHSKLESYGFKLYDEIFDYSFDSMENDDRIENLIKEIYKIKDFNYIDLYDSVKDKIEYNRKLSLEILTNSNIFSDLATNKFVAENKNIFLKMIEDSVIESFSI